MVRQVNKDTSQAPIGYMLKQADAAITTYTTNALKGVGIDRLQWQMLHSIHEARNIYQIDAYKALQNFVDEYNFNVLLDQMIEDGWVVSQQGVLALTDAGAAKHDAAFEIQKRVREQTVKGISEGEYSTVIRALQRLVKNLQ